MLIFCMTLSRSELRYDRTLAKRAIVGSSEAGPLTASGGGAVFGRAHEVQNGLHLIFSFCV